MDKFKARAKRRIRIRARIVGTAKRPRLSVFRSNKFITAQLIDDQRGKTMVYSSDLKFENEKMTKIQRATKVGAELAKLAKKAKISKVVFDRSGYKYHGRVKALAEAAREGGLKF